MATEQMDDLSLARLREPAALANPYALYKRLRESDPVHWDTNAEGSGSGAWVLTRHADVLAVLRDARFSNRTLHVSTEWLPEELQATLGRALLALTRQMLFLDPPDHTRLRGLVSAAFTPRMVEKMRARVRDIAEEQLESVAPAGQMDVIAEFSQPLPVTVIAAMLGVPREDRARFIQWTFDFGTLLDGGNLSLETLMGALQGVSDLMDYLRGVLAEHKAAPRDDLMQAFIAAEERGDTLSEDEVLSNCVLLLAAGNGTTTHLIGNGLLALLRHPDQLERLRREPALLPGAINELLRYDGPVQLTGRVATADALIGGHAITAGQAVLPVLGAANHDPAQFADPDRLDITRDANRHVAFGYGIHFCLGAPLARLEAEVAFAALLRRFPALRLATEAPTWQPSVVFRGLQALPVAF